MLSGLTGARPAAITGENASVKIGEYAVAAVGGPRRELGPAGLDSAGAYEVAGVYAAAAGGGLARGKDHADKRETIKRRDQEREMTQMIRAYKR